MNESEKARLSNALYAAVFEILSPHEVRGYNAHQAAQRISMMGFAAMGDELNYWIEINERGAKTDAAIQTQQDNEVKEKT